MKRLFSVCILMAACIFSYAQDRPKKDPGPRNHERLEADKIAFLVREMNLSVEQAQAFWPVYNEFSKLAEETRQKEMDARDRIRRHEELSNAEAEQALKDLFEAHQKGHEIMIEYTERFKKILPIKSVAAIFAAEDAFRIHLLNQLKEHEPENRAMHQDHKRDRSPKDKKQK